MVNDQRDDEYTRVELPFIEQLKLMGWKRATGDIDVPYLVDPPITKGRRDFKKILLLDYLQDSIRRINTDENGNPWLDDTRINKAISDLERPGTHKLIEANREATRLLIKGTEVEGPDGKQQTIKYIDFENPQNNSFIAINQFRVDPPWSTGDRGFIIPDIVLFINGIPIVVIECKHPDLESPLEEGVEQLLRYSNQRYWVEEPEGAERLFHYVQVMIATHFDRACVGTVGCPADRYLEWKDPFPQTVDELATKMDVDEPSGQQILAAGVLHPSNLLDIIRNCTLFKENDKIIPRYQQYRAIHKAIERLRTGQTRTQHGEQDQRGGIIWHTQGSGKSLTMVFLVRKIRTIKDLQRLKIVIITDRTDLEEQLSETAVLTGEPLQIATGVKDLEAKLRTPGAGLVFGMIQKFRDDIIDSIDEPTLQSGLNDSEDILVLVDEAHRSHTSTLHASLLAALPNCAMIGFTGTPIVTKGKKRTTEIFGPLLDTYTIKQSQEDGATLPILYEGRTTAGEVKDADSLDEIFIDMFAERSEKERAIIRRKYATKDKVLEAEQLIKAKARDMLRHYVTRILPNEFKAQVVAVSRLAAVRYQKAFEEARDELVKELQGLDDSLKNLSDEEVESLESETRYLVEAYPHLETIKQLKFAAIISSDHNDPPSWRKWTSKGQQKLNIASFKKPLTKDKLAFLIVRTMLLVGFDARVEQVLYVDRSMRDHELLQAIARVNRTHENKTHGLVVDYFGIAHHLKDALDVYAEGDIEGALMSVLEKLPILEARHLRIIEFFTSRGLDIKDRDGCIDLLRDDRLRAEFQLKFRDFLEALDPLLHRPEALKYVEDAKRLRYIHKKAQNRYRDENLNLLGIGHKVRNLIDRHIISEGIDPKIKPVDILHADFEKQVEELKSSKAQAAEMEYAVKHHIRIHLDEDPIYYGKLSERLEEILQSFEDNWDALAKALKEFTEEVRAGRPADKTKLDPKREAPFLSLLLDAANIDRESTELLLKYAKATVEMIEHISKEISHIDFWRSRVAQQELRGWIVKYLDGHELVPFEKLPEIADRIVQTAKHNHSRLV
jgi:type I restriction enzyme R subunit